MGSMTEQRTVVIGGVDCHKHTHHACTIDEQGRRLADQEFRATRAGYRELLAWLRGQGTVRAVGVESTGAYGAGLTRSLCRAGMTVIEVNRPHAQLRQRRGKSDPLDAEGAARGVLAGEATQIPKDTTGIVESIRLLKTAHNSAVKARSMALCLLGELVVTAPAELRESMRCSTLKGQATACARLRPALDRLDDPTQATKLALRSVARRILALNKEIAEIDAQLEALIHRAAPRTTSLLGVGTQHAAELLTTLGQNCDRIHSEAAFAHLCAAAPVPASSGLTQRHRLSYQGNRQANRSLHMIAVVRLRYCSRTRAYAKRRRSEGLSNKEIIRCLKRYIARQLYRELRADLGALAT